MSGGKIGLDWVRVCYPEGGWGCPLSDTYETWMALNVTIVVPLNYS